LAKKQRRTQQHRAQQSPRRRSYRADGSGATERYKPGFPVNILTNAKVFYIVGLGVMVGGIVFAAVLQASSGTQTPSIDVPTGTPSTTETVEGTPAGTPTPDPRRFSAAEDVTDPETTDYSATITTDRGVIEIDLFEDVAPNTVNSFVFLAQNGFYDNLRWHRVIEDFVVQAGDPRSEVGREDTGESLPGSDGPGYGTADEPNDLSNVRGTISMAKVGGASTFGSQYFINLKDNPGLDAGAGGDAFYPFGEVTAGMDVVDQIEQDDVIQSIVVNEKPKS
jgi:cyclophilin family peptidyl-prolyl cis-trans isomerase